MRLIRFIGILLILFALICSSTAFCLAGTASAAKQPSGPIVDGYRWAQRQMVKVWGSPDGQLADYQMQLVLHKGNGRSAGGDIYLGNNCKDDFSDIRFTASNGANLLDYWIESYISGVSAVVWVEIDSIPASPRHTKFYIYYGNPAAPSASNGENTFMFFDDFSSVTLDTGKWYTTFKDGGGSVLVSDGLCIVQCNDGVWSSANLYSNAQFGVDTRLRTYIKSYETSDNHDFGFRPQSDGMWIFNNLVRIENIRGGTTQFNGQVVEDGVIYDALMGEADTDWHVYEIGRGSTACEFYIDEDYSVLNVSPDMDMAIWARAEAGVTEGVRTVTIDWITLGNYTENEPTFTKYCRGRGACDSTGPGPCVHDCGCSPFSFDE